MQRVGKSALANLITSTAEKSSRQAILQRFLHGTAVRKPLPPVSGPAKVEEHVHNNALPSVLLPELYKLRSDILCAEHNS